MTTCRKILPALLLLIAGLLVVAPPVVLAHPMGNFSISHFAGLSIETGAVELRYILDIAEIPTFQEMQTAGIVPVPDDPRVVRYLASKAEALKGGLLLTVNGRPLSLATVSENVIFPPGAGNLPTMKIGVVYRATLTGVACPCTLEYRDGNFAERAGWKEVVVTAGPGARLVLSTAAGVSRSQELANYPTDLINSPPQDVAAAVTFSVTSFASARTKTAADSGPTIAGRENGVPIATSAATRSRTPRIERAMPPPGAAPTNQSPIVTRFAPGTIQLSANKQSTPRNKFTELVSFRNLSFWFLFSAAFIAAGLGALHALEPGHGKTIVAAYLVGSKGTARHAVFLGLIVTAAHTAGVYLLGAITLYASKHVVPEHLYPWLGVISGMIIAALASYLMIRAWTGEDGNHRHEVGRTHSHWFASFVTRRAAQENNSQCLEHGGARSTQAAKKVSLTQLLTLGITGGIVPCPAALVVLLGAFSLHRIGFGLFLIVAFSLGLAAVLIAIGLLMVYARQFLARWKSDGPIVKRWLPVASAGFMLILGLGIALRALLGTGVGTGFLAQAKLPSFVGIVLLGLFLGMRHSTDPDHVVAVSTIASRERSVGQGALIGMLWGMGHTLTIFLVGSGIILFGLVIPPRVGLSMEFSVALMLILLGVLNLTGALRWLTERFAPANRNMTRETANAGAVRNTAQNSLDRLMSRYGSYQVFRPFIIGLVHGLAGSAAVALLVLSTIRSPLWAIAYLLVFGLGTIIGMMLMTSAIAAPLAYSGRRFARAGGYLSTVSGLVSAGFGIFLVYQIGIVDGLFRSHVNWIPR
jgi:ABC-type nickel/cobalt efflux system permease component RcnA